MSASVCRAAVLAALILSACSPPARVPGSGGVFDLDGAREALVIPPDDDALAAFKIIHSAASTGDPRAAWAEIHFLVDLFDAARFEPDAERRDQNRRALVGVLDIADGTGAGTTDLVIDAILLDIDRLLTSDRLHAGAQAARTLLEHDRVKPTRAELFDRMVALKSIARGEGPLRANALLRLADFCRAAFRDAVAAPTPFRPGILSYCLYPLYDSDPEPYFGSDAARRPPEPAWQDLEASVVALLDQLDKTGSRIAPLGKALVKLDVAFLDEKKLLLPARPTPDDVKAPMVGRALPYEWTPLVRMGDGKSRPSAELPGKLKPVLAADRRGRVALAYSADAPATAVLDGAAVARAAGADVVELVVGYEQTVKAPVGDYWHGRAPGDKLARLGVIPFALDPLGGAGGGDGDKDAPRATAWDPARAVLGLHLVVGADSWQLVTTAGALPAIAAGAGDPAAELRQQLLLVRAAFPDEDGVVLVPELGATYASLVAAAAAARTDETGRTLFGAQALGARRPATAGKPSFEARVALRAKASVQIVPDELAVRAPGVRQCYQDALDRAPKLAGTLGLEVKQPVATSPPAAIVVSGPKDKALRSCVAQSLSPLMVQKGVQTARVTLAAGK